LYTAVDMRIAELVRNAMTPYRLNLEPGQRVLIVADTQTDPLVVQTFMTAAVTLGVEATVAMQTPLPFHHAQLNPMTVAAMDGADLVHLITSTGSLHSKACHQKQLEGKRFLASEEVTAAMLRQGASTADYESMNRVGQKIYDLWTGGDEVRITSKEGTDLRAKITGRPSWLCAAKVLENPGVDLYCAAFPDGEVGIAPIEETIEGVVVWDTSMHQIGLLNEPIQARVEKGRVVELTGGPEAQRLRAYLEQNGDDESWIIGETAIGINPKARVTGLVREDKKLEGSVHIALGMNTDTGGTCASRTHVDGVLRRPTVVIDGTTVVEDGKLAVAAD
jgi:leucyl aminopeptidase (aminopeptidase T)